MSTAAAIKPPDGASDRSVGAAGPRSDMPDEYWQSVLTDPSAGAKPIVPVQQQPLSQISPHLLRVSCLRCDRVVEVQTADLVRLYGAHAVWKDTRRRLLDNGCQNRTGSREDDGCWPSYDRA